METKYFLLGLLIVVLFVSGCCCCAPPTEKTSVSKPKTTTTLKIISGPQIKLVKEVLAGRNPHMSGDYLIYSYEGCPNRLDFYCKPNSDIYLYDISTEKTVRLSEELSGGKAMSFTDGNWIIFQEIIFSTEKDDYIPFLFLYNPKTKEEKNLNLELTELGTILNFEDARILYRLNQSLYYYNINTEQTTKTEWNKEMELNSIHKNYILSYKNLCNARTCSEEESKKIKPIFLLNLETGEKVQITNDTRRRPNGIHIDFYENKIVWSDVRYGKDNPDVYLYDISAKEEKRITNTPDAGEGSPMIYGDYIVFIRGRLNKAPEVVLYDIPNEKETIVYTQEYSHGNTEILDFHENNILIQTQTAPLTHETLYLFSFTS